MSYQWQQATIQRLTTRTKTGFLSITPTSVLKVWLPEEQYHPIWKQESNKSLPGTTSEPWNSVPVLWAYTHKRTFSFFVKENLRAINSWRRLQDPNLLHTLFVTTDFFFLRHWKIPQNVCIISAGSMFCCFRSKRFSFLFKFFARLYSPSGDESKPSLWHCKSPDVYMDCFAGPALSDKLNLPILPALFSQWLRTSVQRKQSNN